MGREWIAQYETPTCWPGELCVVAFNAEALFLKDVLLRLVGGWECGEFPVLRSKISYQ